MSYYRKRNMLLVGAIVIILVFSFVLSIRQYQNTDFMYYTNEMRTKINDLRYEINQGNYPQSEYEYLVIDTAGIVQYADEIWQQSVGDQVEVEEMLQQDKNFAKQQPGYCKESFTLKDEKGIVSGFVIFLIPKTQVNGAVYTIDMLRVFLPVGIGIVLSCVLLIITGVITKRRILTPLEQISSSAQAIIAGNYDFEVRRVYDEELKKNEVGDLTYSFEMMRDELKAKQISEQALRKAQQELMSCISHDLRTPISTIKAYSEGMRDGVIMEGMTQKDYLNIILEKTNLVEKMIADLLTYSNTQLNKMQMNKKEIYFRDYITEINREIRIFVTQCGVEYTSEIMDENLIVCIDEKRITEVIYNLIENALKYIDNKTGKIKLKAEITDGVASIHVKDNGMGISAEDIPYVFDKFYRAEKSRSSNIPGSGLGLSICKYIVQQHKGEIHCRSRKSQGSEFWFTLNEQ